MQRTDGVSATLLRLGASPWFAAVLWIAAAVIVVGSAVRQVHVAWSGGDLSYFYDRAKDLLAGRDPYAAIVAHPYDAKSADFADIYLYSPAFYWLLSPLTLLKPATAWLIWALFDGVCLLLGPVCFVKAISPRLPVRAGLGIAIALSFTSMARYELYYGNADVVLLFLLAAAFLAARRRHGVLAGVLLGLSAVVYLQSLPFLLFYLWKREYRTALTGALLFGAGTAGGFLVATASALANFSTMAQRFIGSWASFYINQSLYAVARRLFTPTTYSAQPLAHLPWLPYLVWFAAVTGILVVAGRTIPRRRLAATPAHRAGLEFAFALGALIIFFPVLEANTLIVVGLLLAALAIAVVSPGQAHVGARRCLCGGLVLVYALSCLNMTAWDHTRLGALRGLHGAHLVIAAVTSVPYLYLATLTCVLVYAALWLHDRPGIAALDGDSGGMGARGRTVDAAA